MVHKSISMNNLFAIHKTFYKVADFISWKNKEGLVLSPHFQRRSVWSKGTKSYLIDTVFKGLPVPIIFLRDRGINKKNYEPIREVIDGQQRLRTLISYISSELLEDFDSDKDEFLVSKTHNRELANKPFNKLSEEYQDKILNYEFNVHILSSNVDDRDVIQIFRRMNSTNYVLKKQEIRNSQYFGEFKTSQYELAAEQLERWRKWQTFTEGDISRMHEVELTSEICVSILSKKTMGKSPSVIEEFYKRYDEEYKERNIIEEKFRETMNFIYQNFPGNKNDFILFNKRIFYVFFMAIYDFLYGIDDRNSSRKLSVNEISANTIHSLKMKSDRIKGKVAPDNVLKASDRRTTNLKERTTLFKYIKDI